MAYFPFAPEYGARYVLETPDSSLRAVLNDPADPDYVGMASEGTGLDSPEIRESAEDLVESDGGHHGDFYYSRRPITFNVEVFGHTSTLARAIRLDKLRQVVAAGLRDDLNLSWIPSYGTTPDVDYVEMYTPVRVQQPLRFSGAWNKQATLALVSEYAPLFSKAQRSSAATASGATVVVENRGNYPAAPIIRITGASTNPVVTNSTTGKTLRFVAGYALGAGVAIDVDTLNQDGEKVSDGSSVNDKIDYLTSTWPLMPKGNNSFTMAGGGTFQIFWRDAWS
jgi:hypothetical protein